MSIKKRILPLLLILALVPSLMAVPAAAAPSAPRDYYNLFEGVTHFSFYVGGSLYSDQLLQPSEYVKNSRSAKYSWSDPHGVKYTDVYITVYSASKPGSVVLSIGGGKTYDMAYLGSYGNYRQYRATINSTVSAGFNFDFTFNNNYAGYLNIVSASGYGDSAVRIDYVEGTFTNLIYSYTSGTLIDTNLITRSGSAFDASYSSSETVEKLMYCQANITVPSSSLVFDDISSLTFMFVTLEGAFMNEHCNVQVVTQGTDNALILPVDIVSAGSFNLYDVTMGNQVIGVWPAVYWQMTVDLSGIDLKGKDIRLQFQLDATSHSEISGQDHWEQWFFALDGCYISLNTEGITWLNRIGRWFSDLGESVVSAVNNLASVFGDNGQLEQAGDAMSEQADSMQQANNQMNAVDKPELDTDNLLGNFLDFNAGGLTILSSMTSNAFVPQLMVVVFTFALCGYIFFGKKG